MNTNTASINAQFNLNKVNQEMEKAMEQLSSGKRINSAGDDAAGLSIATRMESQVRGLNQAMRNAADGQSMVDTAEGAMNEIANMLQRMRELSLQAANGTNSDNDRSNLNDEVNQLKTEIDRIVGTTTFNGKKLTDGSMQQNLQIGVNAGETLNVNINSIATGSLGNIDGTSGVSGVIETSGHGVEAVASKTQMTFNGDDTYNFKVSVTTAKGTGVYLIEGSVSNNSASDIVEKINAAVRNSTPPTGGTHVADGSSNILASYSGNVVTLENSYGGAIKVEKDGTTAFSNSGSTIGFTSVAGGKNSENVILGTANSFAGKTIENDNAYVAAVKSSAEVTQTTDAAVDDTVSITLTADGGDAITFASGALAVTANDSLAKLLTAFNGLTDKKGFSLEHDTTNNKIIASRVDGDDFTVTADTADKAGTAVGTGAYKVALGTTGTTHAAAAALVDTTASAKTTNGVKESGDAVSNMYLEFTAADTYTLNFKDKGAANATGKFDVVYDGTSTSLSAIATVIGTKIDGVFATASHDVSVTVEGGRIQISDSKGSAFSLVEFASKGSGTIMSSVDAGQGDTTIGDGVLLDDTTYQATGETKANITPKATDLDLTLSASDRYSFNITDGTATAVVGNFAADITSTATTANVAAEINSALKKAGLDGVIVAKEGATAGLLTLTHSNGKEISISNFKSESTGTLKVASGSDDTTAFTRFLDDGSNAAQTISGISVETISDAGKALTVIDEALEELSSERSKLGAISNRLEHTISNLGNVVVNTEAAQSRIEDADFAKVTGDLTKSQIMSQAATAMLAQANASKQGVLSLLQG
ncbi:flagellin [Planktomarina temperata]|nr:flagellin [Planktomarina temperata]